MALSRKNHRRAAPARRAPEAPFADRDHFVPATLAGIALIWGAIFLFSHAEREYDAVARWLRSLDGQVPLVEGEPDEANDNRIVAVQAELIPEVEPSDDFLSPGPHLRLVRETEIYPWGKSPRRRRSLAVRDATFGGYPGKPVLANVLRQVAPTALNVSEEMLQPDIAAELRLHRGWVEWLAAAPGYTRGDRRMRYQSVPAGPFTVVAYQRQQELRELPVRGGQVQGMIVVAGTEPFAKIRRFLTESHEFYSWIYRLYGMGAMWLAMMLILMPFRGRFTSMSFLEGYPRALPPALALMGSFLAMATLRRYPTEQAMAALGLVFTFVIAMFIARNRETPRARGS